MSKIEFMEQLNSKFKNQNAKLKTSPPLIPLSTFVERGNIENP